jgi:hypothetical protein
MRVPGASDRRDSRQNDERTQKQEKRGSVQLAANYATLCMLCYLLAQRGDRRSPTAVDRAGGNGDFFPGQLPCIVCSGVEIGACGSTAFLQAKIKVSESLLDDLRF